MIVVKFYQKLTRSLVFLVIYKPTIVKKKTREMSLLFIEVGNYLLLAFVADGLVQSMV